MVRTALARTRQSDAKGVPGSFERHGEDFVPRLVQAGRFAAAIWDESRQQLLLVRDRLGERPLLHATGADGTVYFASEINALVASGRAIEPSRSTAGLRFRLRPRACNAADAMSGILRAGHLIALSPDSPLPVPRQYWNVSAIPPLDGDPVEILRADLEDIGRIIVRSDVPVGVALSGGLDSSIVASLAARSCRSKATALCVGYEGRPESDERADASAFARHLGIDMIEVELISRDVVSGFDGLVADMGEPIADVTLPTPSSR